MEQRAQWAWDQGPGDEGIQHSQRQNALETAARDWAWAAYLLVTNN